MGTDSREKKTAVNDHGIMTQTLQTHVQIYRLVINTHRNTPHTSVLWHCWLGIRKSIRSVKNWVMRYGYWVWVWLSVWSEVQMLCIWSSWCHCHPIISCFIKIRLGLTFLVPVYWGCPGKEAVYRVSVYSGVAWGRSTSQNRNCETTAAGCML